MANQELKVVRGVVEATAQNTPERYGIRIGRQWYDGFGSCPVERGSIVEIAYVENGDFRDVHGIRIDEEAAEPLRGVEQGDARERHIARAVALKCAARLCAERWATAKDITDLAGRLEKWLRTGCE